MGIHYSKIFQNGKYAAFNGPIGSGKTDTCVKVAAAFTEAGYNAVYASVLNDDWMQSWPPEGWPFTVYCGDAHRDMPEYEPIFRRAAKGVLIMDDAHCWLASRRGDDILPLAEQYSVSIVFVTRSPNELPLSIRSKIPYENVTWFGQDPEPWVTQFEAELLASRQVVLRHSYQA